ncbi:ATPase [Acidimicrobiaceae bacterium USS-CC1]|uniref:histidine kinase n=1 Tax=Acidiferrimicrobium australe TaxID=2664430 RepID=A0ABW9QNS0_9ACTN|nr:ATPase [Acidiferrimicrobium australe]
MATVTDLLHEHTSYSDAVVAHLQRLVATWGTLSDLCFADLLLFVPVSWSAEHFVIVGQVRPTTNRTLHLDDLVGRVVSEQERPLVARGWQLGSVVEGEIDITSRNERARMVCIPVRWQGQLAAVLTRESALSVGRRPGELERTYVEVFDRLARMMANGEFPFPLDEEGETPRVGDGVMVLDAAGRVEFASPNAVNALHRMGLYTSIEGLRLDEVGLAQDSIDVAFAQQLPATQEIIRGPDAALIIRCVPLLDHGSVTGAFVLLHDVTELRRRDRLLMSKDAAIREVHHRVKNNLQTISSLLRLQARRLPAGPGRHALEESERRVRSIAIVHEILSRDTADQVHFNEILPSLVRMAEDLGTSETPVRITTTGDAGNLQAAIATPLAVVVTELLQNAAEHAFPPEAVRADADLRVEVALRRGDTDLSVVVRDNGVGLPPGFSLDRPTSLGLSIVSSLVGTQLGGTIDMRTDGGTVVELTIPLDVVDDDLESL